MKTIIYKNLLIIITLVIISGCAIAKKDKSLITKETEFTKVKKDSSSVKEVSKAIDDKASIKIEQINTDDAIFDAAVNKEVNRILGGINLEKKSGNNYYKLYYDLQNKMLKLETKIGETSNEKTDVNSSEKSEKTFDQQLSEYVKKVVIPWWAYVIGFLFIWPYIKPIIMMFLGPANILTTLSALKNKK